MKDGGEGMFDVEQYVREPITPFSKIPFLSRNKQYGFTKLCNVLHCRYWNEKVDGQRVVSVNCCHPGAVDTDFTREFRGIPALLFKLVAFLFFKNVRQGSQQTLHLACSRYVKTSGEYWDRLKPTRTSSLGTNRKLQDEVVRVCQEAIQPYL